MKYLGMDRVDLFALTFISALTCWIVESDNRHEKRLHLTIIFLLSFFHNVLVAFKTASLGRRLIIEGRLMALRKKHSFLTVGLLIGSLFVQASQAGPAEIHQIERAFNSDTADRLSALTETLQGYDAFIANYRLSTKYFYSNQRSQAADVLSHLIEILQQHTDANPNDAESTALLANVYGFAINAEPAKAVVYGPRSSALMKKAYAMEPNNPMVLLCKATIEYHTPTMFGGSKVKAQSTLQKALSFYQSHKHSPRYWGHDDATILMGLTFLEQGDVMQARKYWQQAVSLAPDNRWATFLLNQHPSL